NENLEAIHFLKQFNEAVYAEFPDVVTIAEESTNWSNVSRPTYTGGLGFGQKWMMGWMHDSLEYFKKEPVYRKYHQDEITFSLVYAFTENFMLPLSHDEVVHGKKSIMGRMPGDEWQRFANLRLLYGLMYAHPGTKLLFMGAELGQYEEWDHEGTLGWHLLNYNFHKNLKKWVQRLNAFYKENKGLHKHQFEQKGFQWIDHADFESSVIVFMRKGDIPEDTLVVACNFTPTARHYYRFGVPEEGPWQEVLNSDELEFGGSNIYNPGAISTEPVPWHLQDFSIVVTLPPLSMTVFQTK
ncbi:MAG: alpha amylase C-terminal domain-containing protein, partial [Cyclobacteriaceae bacterium]|nr:alpha amylase C-terminal domain-containing protein [Cyclobacteriaceae bacterium]